MGIIIFVNMSRLGKDLPTSDDVWLMTNNGLEVFEKEIQDFSITKNVKNPFIEDKNPSARIKQSKKSGLWILSVYNEDGQYYNAIKFIERKYSKTYREAIDYILGNITEKPIELLKKPQKVINSSILYEFEAIPYTNKHKEYFNQGCLNEEFLTKEMDIFAVGKYAINKNVKYPKKNEIMFAYEFKDITGKATGKVKFLTIGKNVEKKDKWRNNINPTEFFYTYKIKDGDLVFISKSNKDCGITQCLGINSIAALSENRANISEGLKKLMPKFPNCKWVLNLGSDKQGFETSYSLSKEFNIGWFNIPKKFLSVGCNDNFEYVKNFGMEQFKQLLIKKQYL